MKKTALITGASSGIGLELATIFAQNHYDLILVARNKKNLNELSNYLTTKYLIKVEIIIIDLNRASSPKEIFAKTQSKTIDILVNNAGFGSYAPFVECKIDVLLKMIDLNIRVLTELTHLFLPAMKKRKNGKILNVASIAGFLPGPKMAVYFATKAYVISLSLALSEEIKGSGVQISTLCPGPTITNFQNTAGYSPSSKDMTAKQVAVIAYKELTQGKRLIVPGFRNKLIVWISQLLPLQFTARILNKYYSLNK